MIIWVVILQSYNWWYLFLFMIAAQFLGDIGRHQEAADYYIKATEWADDDFELIFNTANALRWVVDTDHWVCKDEVSENLTLNMLNGFNSLAPGRS